jgi:hypothetical protein
LLLHESRDVRIALPAVEAHFVATKVDLVVLEQPTHVSEEFLQGRVRRGQNRIDRA